MPGPEAIQAATDIVNAGSGLITAVKDITINIVTSAASVIAASAVIAKYMPPPDRPGFLSKLHKWINAAAQNSGYAANAETKKDGD